MHATLTTVGYTKAMDVFSLVVHAAERITLDHVWIVRMKHWYLSSSRICIRFLYITIFFCDFLRILEKSFSPHVDILITFEKKITSLKMSLHYIFMLHTWSFSRLDHLDYITTLSVPLTHFLEPNFESKGFLVKNFDC